MNATFCCKIVKAYIDPAVTPAGEAKVAKLTSLLVKVGALLVILFLPTQFPLDLQLLGGLWIMQTFPSVVFGLFTRFFHGGALLLGWAVGFFGGSYLAWTDGLKPLHTLVIGGVNYTMYVGLLALAVNIVVAVIASAVMSMAGVKRPQPAGA